MENTTSAPKNPEFSGAPPADLAGLRAWKAARPTHSIIDSRRAAQALASSRMGAKVAQDKLEAKVAPAPLAGDILDGQRICEVFGGVPLTSITSDDLAVGDTVLFLNQLTTVTKIRKSTPARIDGPHIVVTFAAFPEYPNGIRFHRQHRRWAKVAQDKLEARLADQSREVA